MGLPACIKLSIVRGRWFCACPTDACVVPAARGGQTVAAGALREKLLDAMTPGYQAEFDPDEAEQAGAFIEDALSEQDAAESDIDLVDATAPAATTTTKARR